MAADPNAQNATDIQSKFELYFVTLIFTILGLAIQTSKSNSNIYTATLETLSWILLLSSGLIAMRRVIWVPVILNQFAEINRKRDTIKQIKYAADTGNPVIDENNLPLEHHIAINNVEDHISKLESAIKSRNDSNIQLFKIQWGLFIGALICLLSSRGFENFFIIWTNIETIIRKLFSA